MSKSLWVKLGILTAVLAVGALGLGVSYIQYKDAQKLSWRDDGLAAFEEEDWWTARRLLRGYLASYKEDVPVLWKYAEASSNILVGRALALQDAANAYFQIATIESDNEEALRLLIECDMVRRAWFDLEYHTDFFLDERPEDENLRFHHALAADRTEQLETAIREYETLIEEGIARVEVYGNLARILFERGFEDQAVKVFETALVNRADPAAVAVQQAHYYLDRGDLEAASTSLQRGSSLIVTNDLWAQTAALRLTVEREDWDEVEKIALRTIEGGGELSFQYSSLAMAYQLTSRQVKAIDLIRSMDSKFRADNPQFHVFLAELLIAEDRVEEVNEIVEELKSIHPGHMLYHNYLEARVLLANGNAARAASKLTMVVDANPAFKQAHIYLASASLSLGDREAARVQLESYLYNHPSDPDALALYTREFGVAKPLEAISTEAAALLDIENAPARTLAEAASVLYRRSVRLEQKAENKETIVALLEKAIVVDPEDSLAYLILAEILTNYGELAEASDLLRRIEAQDVPENTLRLVKAAIALASDDLEGAQALYREHLSSGVMTVNEIIRWATFFIRRTSLDAGMQALDAAIEQAAEEDRMTLATEQVDLLTRYGDIDGALARLDEMSALNEPGSENSVALLQKREGVIRALLVQGPQHDPARAKKLASELAERYPIQSSIQLLYAQVLLNQDPPDIEGARALTEPLIKSNPENRGVLMAAADIAAKQGNLKLAQDYAEQAAFSRAADAETHIFLARLYMRQQRPQDAINSLANALSRESEHIRALALLVEAYRMAGQMSRAEATIDRMSSLLAHDEQSRKQVELMRGRLHLGQKEDLGNVEKLLREHYAERPEDRRVVVDLATALAFQGKVEEGEDLLKTFVEAHSGSAQAWVDLGRFYIFSAPERDIPKARTALTQALVANRNYLPALLLQLDISLASNRPLQALGFCDRYLSLDPNNLQVLVHKARVQTVRGAYDGALETINLAIQIDPSLQHLRFRGNVYAAMGEYAKAVEDFEKVVYRDDAEDAELLLSMAEAYLALEEVEHAEDYYTRAMRRVDEPTERTERVREGLNALGGTL